MAPELSSNWKRLQAQLKAAPGSQDNGKRKRKGEELRSTDSIKLPNKRQKVNGRDTSKTPSASSQEKRNKTTVTRQPRMGGAQSSKIEMESGVSPSLALWAEDNEISAEDLAEAYGLGIKNNAMLNPGPDRPNEGLAPGVQVGKYVAIDCEMVGIGENGYESALARVSLVDFHGRQVYDSFVRPKERVTDWRTHVSGVSPKHMASARGFDEVQDQVAELLEGRILVGHDLKHDLQILLLNHPSKFIRDTAKFSGFRKYGHGPKPSLRVLAREILGVEIQTGQHSSIEDARITMLLLRRFKSAFDVENANRFPDPSLSSGSASQSSKKAKKKKRKN